MIVLTGTELFAIGPFHKAWTKAEGRLRKVAERYPHISNFEMLARATQQAHLNFTDEEMQAMRRRQPRKATPPLVPKERHAEVGKATSKSP